MLHRASAPVGAPCRGGARSLRVDRQLPRPHVHPAHVSQVLRARPADADGAEPSCSDACEQDVPHQLGASRRSLGLLAIGSAAAATAAAPGPAGAIGVEDFFRNIIRPEDKYSPVEAVVVLMDARSTLREVKALASTPLDSQERFKGRSEWPGLATRLRPAGPAVPIVAALASGGDREQTIGQMYGGKAGESGIVDNVYASLGKVLTISGRTIRREAQESPEPAAEAEVAVDEFLKKVPQDIADEAQAFRVQRAKEYGERFGKPLARLNSS